SKGEILHALTFIEEEVNAAIEDLRFKMTLKASVVVGEDFNDVSDFINMAENLVHVRVAMEGDLRSYAEIKSRPRILKEVDEELTLTEAHERNRSKQVLIDSDSDAYYQEIKKLSSSPIGGERVADSFSPMANGVESVVDSVESRAYKFLQASAGDFQEVSHFLEEFELPYWARFVPSTVLLYLSDFVDSIKNIVHSTRYIVHRGDSLQESDSMDYVLSTMYAEDNIFSNTNNNVGAVIHSSANSQQNASSPIWAAYLAKTQAEKFGKAMVVNLDVDGFGDRMRKETINYKVPALVKNNDGIFLIVDGQIGERVENIRDLIAEGNGLVIFDVTKDIEGKASYGEFSTKGEESRELKIDNIDQVVPNIPEIHS
ncbi:hypothetical protein MNBD_BACTEROID05-387, partial [hydrothermal vent metagenome]